MKINTQVRPLVYGNTLESKVYSHDLNSILINVHIFIDPRLIAGNPAQEVMLQTA